MLDISDEDDEQHVEKAMSLQEHQTIEYPSETRSDEARLPSFHAVETSSTYGGGESIVSVLSNYSIAQKAIAEAARAELQRQKELAEYTERRHKYATSDASSAFTNDNLEEEVARLIAEKESRFQAERAVALMRAQRELEAERKARIEAEAARLKVEEELERLKLKEIPIVNEAPSDRELKDISVQEPAAETHTETSDVSEKQDDVISPCAATQPVVEQELLSPEESSHQTEDDYSEFERMISDAKAAKVTVEDEMERLELEDAVVGDEVVAVDEMKSVPDEQAQRELSHQEVGEKARMEAEASRLRAEKELERLRASRFSLEVDETAPESVIVQADAENKPDLLRMSSKQSEDDVEVFRHGYSTDDESQHIQSDDIEEKAPADSVALDALDSLQISESMKSVEPQAATDSLVTEESQLDNRESELGPTLAQGYDEHELLPATAEPTPRIPSDPAAPGNSQTDALRDISDSEKKYDVSSRSIDVSPSLAQDSKSDSEEAIIHHVARVTFEGNPSKGQLSFTTGSKVEAHSNQRGPWWLGRCGGRTGWFPASAIVPESEFLANVIGPLSGADEPDASESVEPLSGDDLNAVYDLIRNPSDPISQDGDEGDSDDESGSPAKSRWLDTENGKSRAPALPSRDHSPPPTRLDPFEMAGLSERLYEPQADDLHSNEGDGIPPSDVPKDTDGDIALPSEDVGETLSTEELVCVELADVSKNDAPDAVQPQSEISAKSDTDKDPKVVTKKPRPKPEWRATKDPKSGFIYYYHTGTREVSYYSIDIDCIL